MRISGMTGDASKFSEKLLVAKFINSIPECEELLALHMSQFRKALDLCESMTNENQEFDEVRKARIIVGAIIFSTTNHGLVELGKSARMYMNEAIGKQELRNSIKAIVKFKGKGLNHVTVNEIYNIIKWDKERKQKGA